MNDKLLGPNLNFPDVVIAAKATTKAAEAVARTAEKWGQVADALLGWQLPIAFALGALAMLVVISVLTRRRSDQ